MGGSKPSGRITITRSGRSRDTNDFLRVNGWAPPTAAAVPGDPDGVACAITRYLGNSSAGVSLTNQRTQAGVSVDVPMYSPYRFQETNPTSAQEGQVNDQFGTLTDTMNITYATRKDPTTPVDQIYSDREVIEMYVSAGTDFTLLFFLNIPVLYQYAWQPLPAATP